MFLVDSHCHLDKIDYQQVQQELSDVLAQARQCEVKLLLSVCTTLSTFKLITELIGGYEEVLFSCGIHPLNIKESDDVKELRCLSADKRVVALGETGLDYYYQQDNKAQQQELFSEHIRVGRELYKPVIVHTRQAGEDTLAVLRAEQADKCGGVVHCFTEDLTTAKKLLDFGFYISFSGIVTFRRAEALRQAARYVPLDRLLLETDAPYLAPVPFRGKENKPAYLRNIAEYIAILKGVSLEELASTTSANFGKLFHVDMTGCLKAA